jgi:hypothetical protein
LTFHPIDSIARRQWVDEVPRLERYGIWLDEVTPAVREAAWATDGQVVPGLFAPRDEGAPTAGILAAVGTLLGLLTTEQLKAVKQLLSSPTFTRGCLRGAWKRSKNWLSAGAGEGNRTLVCSLGSCRSTIELRPRAPHVARRRRQDNVNARR